MSKADLRIDWATHEAAKYAVENWHYSKSLPAGKMAKIGIWENNIFVGCIIYAYGANHKIGSPYNLKQKEVCELVRVAMKSHQCAVTRALAISFRLLKKQSKGLRLIVSYADTGQGHEGKIYQASNWIYEGYFDGEMNVVVNGKTMHRRQAYSLYGTTKPKGYINVPKPGKHKYLMPLDAEMKAAILPLSKPYPKRASSETNDTPGDHPGEGGATPTDALHLTGGDNA